MEINRYAFERMKMSRIENTEGVPDNQITIYLVSWNNTPLGEEF